MIDKDTTKAAPGRGRLSAEKITELKELAKTRGLEIQKRLRERDPFSQLEFTRAKKDSREVEKQIKLGFSDARAPEDDEQTHSNAVLDSLKLDKKLGTAATRSRCKSVRSRSSCEDRRKQRLAVG